MSYNDTGTLKKRKNAHLRAFSDTASVSFVPAHGIRAQGEALTKVVESEDFLGFRLRLQQF